jgi:L-threonylcarbamoyladenylate synthase
VEADVERAAEVLRAGGAVVLPTDTVYGLAALPGHIGLLAELKGRPAEMPVAVLVASVDQARELAGAPMPAEAERLAAAFWPGPLTLVVPARSPADSPVGIRWPDHPLVQAIAARVGPIATTSANRHGHPTPRTAAEASASLLGPVGLVIDGGVLAGSGSTVVDLTGSAPAVLRVGPLAPEVLFADG